MGSGIVKNLINSGHNVCVYNRTHDKTEKFEKAGAKVMLTPSDVIEHADITFSCVSDPEALQNVRQTLNLSEFFVTFEFLRRFSDRTASARCRQSSHMVKGMWK